MRPWIDTPALDPPVELVEAAGGQTLVARALLARGITTPAAARAFLDPSAAPPADPFDLPGMAEAVEHILRAIHEQKPIVVWGDFDVDGQTSTTVLVSALRELGAQVSFHIPNREKESHGVNLAGLKDLIDQGAGLVVTCDTGITAHAEVDYARSRGVDMVITDHHLLPPTLPGAVAVVNTHRLPPAHPMDSLPGVGVAYELAEALFQHTGQPGGAAPFLDLAALGIVADLAPLTGETRRLLQLGLEALRHTRRLGLQLLMKSAEIDPAHLSEEHISFALAPRLNALGRLDDAAASVEFLTTHDPARAQVIASQLEGLNAERKLLTDQVLDGALAQLEKYPEFLKEAALVLSHPAWPGGVIGLVAGRLAERFHRPAVLITCPPGQVARGSARSVKGIDITAAIAAHQDMLTGFGGHAMAGGLSMAPGADLAERIARFRRALSITVSQMAGGLPPAPELVIDARLPLSGLTLELVKTLERLAPFGPGNPPLVLASSELAIASQAKIGKNNEHRSLTVKDESGQAQKVIWWGAGSQVDDADLPQGRFDLAYTARTSDYRGQAELQVEWIDARPLEEAPALIRRPITVVDYRLSPQKIALVKRIVAQEEAMVWAEAGAVAKLAEAGIPAHTRQTLMPATTLIVWTAPPALQVLRTALQAVSPESVYLVATSPETAALQGFLERLAGLVKYILRTTGGKTDLATLAAACAQTEPAVRKGLEWLAAMGHIALLEQTRSLVSLGAGNKEKGPSAEGIAKELKAILGESAAYRDYLASTDKERLVPID